MMTTLGELLSGTNGLIQTGPFGSQLKQKEYSEEGIPVVMPTNINEGKVATDGIAYITEEKAQALNRHKVKIDSILLPRRGEISKRAFITEKESGWICGTGCIKIEINRSDVVPKYLYYLMGTADSVSWLTNNAVGTTMLNLSASILQRFPVSLPSIETQRKTVSVLSNYDNLIENNRRRIALLEESARLLYREWFTLNNVNKEDCLSTPLSEVIEITRGHSYTSKEIDTIDGMPFVNLKCVNRLGGFNYPGLKMIQGNFKQKHLVEEDDIVMAVTDMTRDALIVGRPALITHLPQKTAVFSMDLVKINPKEQNTKYWLYSLLKFSNVPVHIREQASGTNVLHLKPKYIQEMKCLLPSLEDRVKFSVICKPYFRKTSILEKTNERLAKGRDLLLSRLMDGRIAV